MQWIEKYFVYQNLFSPASTLIAESCEVPIDWSKNKIYHLLDQSELSSCPSEDGLETFEKCFLIGSQIQVLCNIGQSEINVIKSVMLRG